MALVHFLVFFGFCVACWWVIHWFLKRYVSSKPWHRWVRYAVWVGCIGLLTFDSIYYQIAVVHGMCEADKKRTYPAPPASLVVGGPYTDDELMNLPSEQRYPSWPCKKRTTEKYGSCVLTNVLIEERHIQLLGGSVDELLVKNQTTGEIYKKGVTYRQTAQWLSRTLFGFGIIWTELPESCKFIQSKKQEIILN